MGEVGLVVNALGAMPDWQELQALGLSNGWGRSIVYDLDEFDAAVSGLKVRLPNVRICALLNSETAGVGNDYDGWEGVVSEFSQRFDGLVEAVECGNELDLLGVDPQSAADLVVEASPYLRNAGMKVILPSVAGPNWVDYLTRLAKGTQGAADWCCVHPYGQRVGGFPRDWGFGEMADLIQTANDASGLPVVFTESGIKIGDAGGLEGQAAYVRRWVSLVQSYSQARLPFACYFAWRDDIGGPSERGPQAFGLREEQGFARPAWQAFAVANGVVTPPRPTPPPEPTPAPPQSVYVLGFADFYAAAPELLGKPLENERGGIPGLSFQATERGFLTAAYLPDPDDIYDGAVLEWHLTFYESSTRYRYELRGSDVVRLP